MIEKALRLTREFHRMKQVDLARRLNISTSYLSEIESGKKPVSLDLLDSYAQVFRIPASTFLLFKERAGANGDSKQKDRANRLLNFFEWVTSEDGDEGLDKEEETAPSGASKKTISASPMRPLRN